MPSNGLGYAPDEICNRNGCQGVIDAHPVENCSCHIAPPCASCTAPRGFCPECGWEEADDPLVVQEIHTIHLPMGFAETRKRVLDPSKIDYIIIPHSSSSQLCRGVYPPGTTREEIKALVDGTFGGRFNYMRDGKFEYVAYTD